MNLHSYRLKFTKKALALLLATLLLVNNAYAFKWTPTAVEYVKKGVEVTVKSNTGKTATKVLTAGSKSVVNKAPSSLLVQGLIYLGFEAVDYVLDPANNSVRVVNDTGNCRVTHAGGGGDWNNKEFGSVQEVYDAVLSGRNEDHWVIQNKHVDKQSKTFSFELRDINPNSSGGRWQYSGTCMPTETQVSYDDVANAIDELAKQGDKTAQETLKTAVADEIADGLHDNALDVDVAEVDKAIDDLTSVKDKYKTKDKAKEQEKADEKTKEKEQGKDKPFELPDFCVFAKSVCDFLEQEPPAPEAPKTIPKANLSDLGLRDDIDKKRIDFVGTCPTKEMTFTLRGQTVHEAVPMYHLCNLLEKIAPWLVGFTYLSCVIFIVRSV